MDCPFSQACENNKAPILAVLHKHFSSVKGVLEVGSGTGQHAVYFAENLPHLEWQAADQQIYLAGILAWVKWASLDNLPLPLALDVNQPWPVTKTSAIFSANTLHIMSWKEVERFFTAINTVLESQGVLCIYGPFNYDGKYSSESNARFDRLLKERDTLSGIRDFEAVNDLAFGAGLSLEVDYPMPANNRCLVWTKQ
jgi:cyclopropane fatty-acyl-phospholipid synthase-like methyltransferase